MSSKTVFTFLFRLIFKHRVMTKAKLGRSVAMDIQKFKVQFTLCTMANFISV